MCSGLTLVSRGFVSSSPGTKPKLAPWNRRQIDTFFIFATSLCRVNLALFNPLNPELNPICYLLALLGAHHLLHVIRIKVKSLTLRRLMSYIYGAPILDVSRSHTSRMGASYIYDISRLRVKPTAPLPTSFLIQLLNTRPAILLP